MENLGRAIAFAPLPIPFREENGFENYVIYNTIELRHSDGSLSTMAVDRSMKKLIGGPHRYQIAGTSLFIWGPRFPYHLIEPIFQEIFCRSHYNYIFGDDVRGATIFYYSKRSDAALSQLMFHCHD